MSMSRPGSLGAWVLAARIKTLPAAIAPVVVGASVAWAAGGFAALPALLAALGAIWIQIGTNFANDVFDFEKGADTETRKGPTRAVQAGLLSTRQMRLGMVVAFAVATACGAALTFLAGWPVIAIGVASVASGIAYTGGPFPLGYNGLGDVFVFLFFGLVAVLGTVYVQMQAVPALAWWAAIPVGSLATAILVVNNIRDADTDVHAGKRTLAVRFGVTAARIEYLVLVASSFAIPVWLWVSRQQPWLLLPVAAIPLAARVSKDVWHHDDAAVLNRCLARTAGVLLVHSALLAAGLILAAR